MDCDLKYYPLTHPQKGIWYTEKLYPGTSIGNIAGTLKIRGNINFSYLEKAVNLVIEKNDSLRLRFIEDENGPMQYIAEYCNHKLDFLDFSNLEIDQLYNWDTHQTQTPFTKMDGDLFYFALVKTGENNGGVYIQYNHLIGDGWTIVLLTSEIMKYYSILKSDSEVFENNKPSYIEYILEEQDYIISEKFNKDKEYWNEKFKSVPDLTTLKLRKSNSTYLSAKRKSFIIPTRLSHKIREYCLENRASLFTLFLAAFSIYINRVTGKEELVFGTPVLNRSNAREKATMGMFVSTAPVNVNINGRLDFTSFINEISKDWMQLLRHQKYPFDLLLHELREKNKGFEKLYDMTLSYQNAKFQKLNDYYEGRWHFNGYQTESLNIHINDREDDGNIIVNYDYLCDLFYTKEVEFIHDHIVRILWHALDNPSRELFRIEMISEREKHKVLYEFNNTQADYPKNKLIHQLFEEQVENTPDNIAVVFENQKMTYRELNNKANQLAKILRNKGIKQDNIVGIVMDRSIEMIVGTLAVLKAGGAYLPIDPSFPQNRILSILNDSNPQIVLTTEKLNDNISFTALKGIDSECVVPIITEGRSQIKNFDDLPLPDRSLINMERYSKYIGQSLSKNTIAVQATRGCPYQCIYCHKVWPKKHVVRSAKNIFDEIMLYYDMGIRRFSFIDDIFNLDVKNSSEFFNLVIRSGIRIQMFFPNGLRGDIITHEYIDLMVAAGTVNIAFALETASPRLQRLIKKNLDLDRLKDNLLYLADRYPHVILELFTMHGFPTETEEEAMMTMDFINSIKWIHFPYVHILKIYPGTDMEKLSLENGISPEAIEKSAGLAYHELPETLPFPKSFARKYQSTFLSEYVMLKERLLKLLPMQMKILTEDELIQKYDSYLPVDINCFDDLLNYLGISREELGEVKFLNNDFYSVDNLDTKMKKAFPKKEVSDNALKILFLDLSQFFSNDSNMLYDVSEPPLGHIYLLTYLNEKFGNKIQGKIAKSRIDFDNYAELKELIEDFKPDVIGIRTLTYYRDFFHKTVSIIRQWGIDVPVIAGGPYATSSYANILKDMDVDLVILGEGELTLEDVIGKIIDNDKKLPDQEVLKTIPGISFINKKDIELRNHTGRDIIMVDLLPEDIQMSEDIDNIANINDPRDLAYIIYTSGSTGNPKGVMIEHRNVVRLLFNSKMKFDFNDSDTWTMFHSFCFDFSVWEMYGALLYGGKLIVVPKAVSQDPCEFLKLLEKEDVSVLNQIPTAFYNLVFEEANKKVDLKLRYVIFGGEALKPMNLKTWKERYPDVRLINMYGITETTVHVSYREIDNEDIRKNSYNIGVPIPTLKVYIFDKDLQLLPIGVKGEIYVGGDGVARGYFNRPELTESRFIENPYIPGERLYRSGDAGRWYANGEIEYLGRLDHQVKIRGFRVELGEIENKLLSYQGIKDAVVLIKEDSQGNNRLYAYLVCEHNIDLPILRRYLVKELPHYMIPAYYMIMEKMPVTDTGKADTKALMQLNQEIVIKTGYVEPQNEFQKRMVEIWQDILKVDSIGINDNFFELGGDSLSIIQIQVQIYHNNWNLKAQDFYSCPTIAQLYEKITDSNNNNELTQDKIIKIRDYMKKEKAKGFTSVLLTGSTGFLGIHLLKQLLEDENTKVYCLIRGKSENDAVSRLRSAISYYFGEFDDNAYNRIKVIKGDITNKNFGLTVKQYDQLANNIDIVIHAAALVKHYGDYGDFDRINVHGTNEIVNFSLYHKKVLHYISTISIAGNRLISGNIKSKFKEDDIYIGQNVEENVYIKSKFEAEKVIINAVKNGLKATIYRVGNLTGRYDDGRFQINIGENAFYNRLKSIFLLGIISDRMKNVKVDITPVDYCSQAIILLAKSGENNTVYHIYNNQDTFGHYIKLFGKYMKTNINILNDDDFKNYVLKISKEKQKLDGLSGIINELDNEKGFAYESFIEVDNKRTIKKLHELGFKWPDIDLDYMSKIIDHAKQVDYWII